MPRFCRLLLSRSLLPTIGAVLLVSATASAQDFASCAKIADNEQRLACFDHASQTVPTTPAVQATPATPPTSSFNPFALFGRSEPLATKPEDFGRTSLPVTAPRPAEVNEPEPIRSITATAIKIIDPEGKPTFVLDNNQTWVSVKYIRIVPRSKGSNTVKIESSAVGYLMTLNDASFQFGVRRLK